MNGFLVLLVHTMDDLPVGLFQNYTDAYRFASKLKPMPTMKMRKVLETDCSTPCNVKIVRFFDGVPVNVEIVKEF